MMGPPTSGWLKRFEEVRPRLKPKPLPEFELPPQRQIDVGSAEFAQGVSSGIPFDRDGRCDECRLVDSLSAGASKGMARLVRASHRIVTGMNHRQAVAALFFQCEHLSAFLGRVSSCETPACTPATALGESIEAAWPVRAAFPRDLYSEWPNPLSVCLEYNAANRRGVPPKE